MFENLHISQVGEGESLISDILIHPLTADNMFVLKNKALLTPHTNSIMELTMQIHGKYVHDLQFDLQFCHTFLNKKAVRQP